MQAWQAFKNGSLKAINTAISLSLRGIGGVWGWLASFVFGIVWARALEPAIRFVFRKARKQYVENENKKAAEKLREAKTDKEVDEAIDDMP